MRKRGNDMGIRFRKSVKIAPGFKINFNKNSVSATIGAKGAHYTVNSKGKRTASIGIPGTGISYVETKGGRKKISSQKTAAPSAAQRYPKHNKSNNNNNGKKWYQKTGWIIAWLIIFFPIGIFLMWKYSDWKKAIKIAVTTFFGFSIVAAAMAPTPESVTLSADTSKVYDINQDIPIDAIVSPKEYKLTETDFEISGGAIEISDGNITFSSTKGGNYEVFVEYGEVISNKLKFKIEDKKAIAKKKAKEEAKKKAEEEARLKAEEEKRRKEEEERIKAEEAKKAEQERIAAEKAEQQKAEEAARIQEEQKAAATPQEPSNNDPIVYITNTGSKYHTSGCRTLKKSKIEKHLSEVKGNYDPCGICSPPR